MTSINLLPWRAKKQAIEKKNFIMLCVVSAILALLLNLIWYSIIQSQINFYQKRYNLLQQEMMYSNVMLARKNFVDTTEAKLLLQLHTLQELHDQRYRIVDLLSHLSNFLPNGVTASEIKVSRNKISIKGEAPTEVQVSELVDNFKKETDLTQINLKQIANPLEKKRKITFHITFNMA